MFTKLKQLFSKKDVVKPNVSFDPTVVFNVERFNTWFCNPDNNAVYANSGIFLRLDKLSESHIVDYMEKEFNVQKSTDNYTRINNFYYEIRADWMKKISNK